MNSRDDAEYRSLGRTGWKAPEISFGARAIGGSWGQASDEDAMAAFHKAVDCGFNWLRWKSIGFEMLENNTTVSISSLNDIQSTVGISGATDVCETKVRFRHSQVGHVPVLTPEWAFEAQGEPSEPLRDGRGGADWGRVEAGRGA